MASNSGAIAIIGVGCRFPGGANSPERLWKILSQGRNTWSEVPEERFNWRSFYHADPQKAGMHNHRGGHFLDDNIAAFDGRFFGITPQECEAIDPQYRIQLEVTYEAFENAGIPLKNLRGSDTAVYVATFGNDYTGIQYKDLDNISKYHLTGTGSAMASNQISYFFDLRGPSITLDTGCSGSMVAIHQACQSLRTGESRMAVAGGVSLIITPDMMVPMSMFGILNKDGKCYSFDSRGEGYGRGEGAAMVVLKNLDNAIRDGDHIRALIRSTGVGQDGKTLGITDPSRDAQLNLIRSVYRQVNLNPQDTKYIEAHDTGTKAGDIAEIEAIRAAFKDDGSPIHVGSIKPNIGHLESASGIASLIKAILMLENDAIPPNLNLENLKESLRGSEIDIPTRLERWDDTALRRISINNYGYGGTISHIILDSLSTYHKEISAAEGPSHEKTINHVNSCGVGVQRNGVEKAIGSSANNYLVDDIMSKLIADIIPTRSVSQSIETYEQSSECQATFPQLLVLTAKSESSLAKSVENLKQWISQKSDLGVDGFRNLAYTLSSRRSFFLWRYTLTGTSLKDVLSVLSSKRSNPTKSETKNKIVFVFTGQGAQWFAMGRELMRFNSAYLASLQASDRILTDFGASWSLEAELLKESSHSRVYESQIAQPATTALQIALVDLLSCIDILPNFVIGHSSGEIAAAYAAGSLDRYSAMKVAYYRGLLRVSSLLKGAMLAVGLCEKSVSHYISQVRDGELVVACSNSPESSTVSGDEAAILELKEILDAKSIFSRRLAVDTAYHSHHIRSVAEEYLHNLDGLEHDVVSPSVRFISSVTGKEMTSGFGPHYWVANLVSKVQFQSVLEELCRKTSSTTTQGRLTFLEVGPHGALSGPIRQTLASLKLSAGYLNISVLIRKQDARYTLLEAVGKLFEQGHSVNLEAANLLFESDPQRRLISDFPTYPWDHSTTHWCESRLSKAHRFRKHPYHDLLGTRIPSSTNLNPIWRHVISVDQLPWVREHIIDGFMIFPASGYISMAIEAMHQWNSEKYESQVINISSYILKNIRIPSALMVQDSPARVELQLSLNTNRSQQDNSKSKWDEFRVSSISANGSSIEHCHGLIMARLSAEVDDVEAAREKELNGSAQIAHLDALEAVCNEKLNCMELYRDLRSRGNGYGPNFACNKELSLDKTSGFGILSIPDVSQCMPMQIQQPHIIHPATLDALMHQALAIFNRYTQDNTFMVVGIDELKISSNIANEPGTILKLATTTTGSGSKFPSADTMAFQKNSNLDMEGVIEINNAKFRATGGGIKTDVDANSERNMSYSMIWDLDADFMTSTMLTPDSHALEPGPSSEHASGLLNQAAAIYIERCVKRLMVNSPTKLPERFHHLFKRIFELQQSIEFSNLLKSVLDSEVESLLEKTYSLGEEGRLLQQLGSQLESILNGKIDALSSIKGDDVICRLCLGYIPSRCHTHLTEYIKKLVFKDPNMRVIELGAGVGGTTASLLHTLDSDGALPFKEYIITDVSSGFLERSRSRFQKWDSYIRYKKLDFTSDISKQDFEKESFDLIIAGNCFHAAPNLDDVISHIRKLLKPGGRLVMIENTHLLPFYKVLIGLLNDWEAGIEDVRIGSKILTTKLWHNTLIRNGFNGVEIVEGKAQCMAMMVSKAALRANDTPDRANSPLRLVLCPSWTTRPPKFALELSSELNRLGFCLTMECLLTTEFAAEAIFIFLDNGLEPVLTTEDSRVFEHTKSLLLNTTRVLWISCQENPTVNMNPAKGMIAGLARVVRAENESLQLITIDVQDTVAKDFAGLIRIIGKVLEDGISNVLQTPAKELEYVYRNQRLLIPRLISNGRINDCVQQAAGKVMLQAQPFHQPNRPLKLHVSKPGFFDSLLFVDDESLRGQLEASDIEIQVEACGVNFKDILIALGRFNKEMSMTAEFAGKITRVGSIHEGSFQVGDRVCGWGGSSYASTIRLHGHRVAHIPPSMSFELAASIPIAFATAYHGLVEIARLQKDQTVLIHSASGGVGQAALQIAQSIGAEMFVTVGDATKRQLLIKEFGIPEDHIFSSKLRTFRQGILRITNGHGVNVVLNSLSGDGLQESWDCIARFGTFVELGKADALENAGLSMAPFERNVTFASVDLQMIADYQPAKIASLLKKILKRFSNGTYSPISPITTIAIGDIEEAFRLVQTRKHTGKIVLKCGFEALVKAPAMTVDSLSSSFGTCLIAGGLGGLGLEIARFLASHGLKHIALMSRRHLPPSRLTELEEEFQRLGTKIYVLNCDITDISKLIESISPFGLDLPPIKSVIQASTVLQDCAFSQMSLQDFKRATLPKCEGTNNLIEVLKDQSLDFFLMLSSIAGILGMITQGNYAAGNNYMDTLAQNRSDSETGITHLVSLNFGPVDDAGILTNRRYAKERMVRRGFVLLKLKEVLALVKYAISHQARNEGNKQLILGFDYKSIAQSNNTRNLKNPMFSHLIEVQSRENFKDTSPPIQTIQTLIAAIKNADEIELLISEEIARKISDLVAISYEEIDIQHRMAEFGLDSLVTIELKNWITQTFQAKLQASEISDAAHIKALSGIVASRSGLISRDPPDQNYSDDDRRSNPGANGTNFTERRNDEAIILPKQPLPDLDNSLRQFLDSLLPVLTPQEYTKYKGYTNDFCKLNGFGRMLQSRLAQLADNPKVENWLSEFYATGMSLRNRRPLVPWCNFFATHPVAVVPHTAAERAAIISTSAFHFKKKLEAGEIGYEYINEQPTDKDAYHWFFNATRESGTSTDIMKKYPGEDYLVAFRRGHAYKISLGDMDVANSHPALQVVFQNILEAAEKPESWVGILTHDTRDRWAANRLELQGLNDDNKTWIHYIEAAAFVIYLDEVQPQNASERGPHFLHANGFNRWCDKTIQFSICDNGVSATIGEHTMLDALTLLRLNDFITKAIITFDPRETDLPMQPPPTVDVSKPYTFTTTLGIDKSITRIVKRLRNEASRYEVRAFEITTVSRHVFRLHKCPPNSGFQLAIQLAVRRYFGYNPAAFEPVSLNHFRNGRVDINHIMCPSMERFCAAAVENKSSTKELQTLFFDAARTHASNVVSTSRGHGFDRHLFGLECSIREGEEVPALFTDSTYKSKRRPPKVMTNCIGGEALEGGRLFDHPDGLSITFETKDELTKGLIWGPIGKVDRYVELLKESSANIRAIMESGG